MADPICRWRNPYFKTVRELINVLPNDRKNSMLARQETNSNFGTEFFVTPYQLACQLGLYYEDQGMYYPRFYHNPTVEQIYEYLGNWILKYYIPNPYTKSIPNIEPFVIHSKLCELLIEKGNSIPWSEAKSESFGFDVGNDDILTNAINTYSNVIRISGNLLMTKDGVLTDDLKDYVTPLPAHNRNDKSFFFNFIEQFDFRQTESLVENTILYGAPGTGKSHRIESRLKDLSEDQKERITFHPEYDYYSFVGGYKPSTDHDIDGKELITYSFVPQVFTNIYVKAWKNPDKQFYLAIEEINRGNCAEIFGDLFQLLDRSSNYSISPSKELLEYLQKELAAEGSDGIAGNKMKLPNNLHLLASMNTSDQSLFPMDSAFKRRWSWEYVPINYNSLDEKGNQNPSFNYLIRLDSKSTFKWIEFIKEINTLIKRNPNLGSDKCIGNYFIKPSDNEILLEEFINKAIFYLWLDVFKDEEDSVFKELGDGISYEDFFPVTSNGKELVIKLLENMNIDITAEEIQSEQTT